MAEKFHPCRLEMTINLLYLNICMKQDVLNLSSVFDSWQHVISQNTQFTKRLQGASLCEAVTHGEHAMLEAILKCHLQSRKLLLLLNLCPKVSQKIKD